MPAELSLTIHYAVEAPALPRWRIRRWVERAMLAAQQDGQISFTRMQVGLRLVGLKEAQQLNAGYRHKDYATNVLTFEYRNLHHPITSTDSDERKKIRRHSCFNHKSI